MGTDKAERKRKKSEDPVVGSEEKVKKKKKKAMEEATEGQSVEKAPKVQAAGGKKSAEKKKQKRAIEEPVSTEKKKKEKKRDKIAPFGVVDTVGTKVVDPSTLSPIATPLADGELSSQIYETVKKAAKGKQLRRGIREVAKAIRKGQKGFCVFAGDVFPVDVIAHLPLACEEADIPYCYVPNKEALGHAALTKRPTSVLLILDGSSKSDFAEDYNACRKSVRSLKIIF